MSIMSASLQSVAIPYAKEGYGVVARREEAETILPRGESATNARREADEAPRKSAVRRELTPAEQRQVAELQQIDRAVRAHEQAHMSAGRGVVTSGASFTYTYGPDGRQYAVGGEVGIDTSYEKKPEDNIDKGRRIQAAALAPRDPSPQDHRVASIGAQMEGKGHADLARQRREEMVGRAYGSSKAEEAPSFSIYA